MKKRDRRLTPISTFLAAGWAEAVHREGTEVKPDTASEKADLGQRSIAIGERSEPSAEADEVGTLVENCDTISVIKSVLDGEGTSKDLKKSNSEESMDTALLRIWKPIDS